MQPFHEILSRPPREAFPAFMQAWLGRPRGYTVFYAENQWVWVWAIADDDLDAEDPPVWSREYHAETEWAIEAPDVSTSSCRWR